MRFVRLARLSSILLALCACSGSGGGGGPGDGGGDDPACIAGAACTPAAACSRGEVRCDAGVSTCVATAPLPDGTACGEGATCDGGTCQRTITVTALDRHVDDAGHVVTVPRASLGDAGYRALVLGADGEYRAYPASVVAPGVLEIPGVPVGPCLVQGPYMQTAAPYFIELSGNALDVSSSRAGRPDVAATQASVELVATGLAPWQGSADPHDWIEVVSSNAGERRQLLETGLPDGATEGSLLPWRSSTPLLDGAAGDRVQVVQLGRVDGPVPHVAALRSGSLPATFRVEEGVPQVAPVALGPIERTGTLEADWALGEMEALLEEMGPSPGQWRSHQLTIRAAAHGLQNVTPTLLWVETGLVEGGTLRLGPLSYGRPYPDLFVERASASMLAEVRVPLALPWEEPHLTVHVAASVSLGAPSTGRLAAQPDVSPPRAVRVDGREVSRDAQLGVGAAPTLSWAPPSLGTAVHYAVAIYRVAPPSSVPVARFSTSSTEVKLPPDLLEAGVSHFARIAASSATGYAETVTAAFVP